MKYLKKFNENIKSFDEKSWDEEEFSDITIDEIESNGKLITDYCFRI